MKSKNLLKFLILLFNICGLPVFYIENELWSFKKIFKLTIFLLFFTIVFMAMCHSIDLMVWENYDLYKLMIENLDTYAIQMLVFVILNASNIYTYCLAAVIAFFGSLFSSRKQTKFLNDMLEIDQLFKTFLLIQINHKKIVGYCLIPFLYLVYTVRNDIVGGYSNFLARIIINVLVNSHLIQFVIYVQILTVFMSELKVFLKGRENIKLSQIEIFVIKRILSNFQSGVILINETFSLFFVTLFLNFFIDLMDNTSKFLELLATNCVDKWQLAYYILYLILFLQLLVWPSVRCSRMVIYECLFKSSSDIFFDFTA
jgi:hypothetical protein